VLSADFEPDSEIKLLPNSTSSRWADITLLVHSQDVDALSDDQLANNAFLEAMKDTTTDWPEAGISWRWSLAAKADSLGVDLVLQVLNIRFCRTNITLYYKF